MQNSLGRWYIWLWHSYSDAGNYDRIVIQELLKEIAQTQQVDLNAKQRFKGAQLPSAMLLTDDIFKWWLSTRQIPFLVMRRRLFAGRWRSTCQICESFFVQIARADLLLQSRVDVS